MCAESYAANNTQRADKTNLLAISKSIVNSSDPSKETTVSAALKGLSAVKSINAQRWISAIANDDIVALKELSGLREFENLVLLSAVNGKNALMVASKRDDLEFARKLVKGGASIHDMTQTKGTAFMFAVLGNSRSVGEWLVSRGADINIVGSNGWTALTIAAAKGNLPLLQWLIELGADAQVRDVYRYTPLLRAVDNGHVEIASYLLKLDSTDINARDEYDNTALHHAASSENIELVKILLKAAADPSLKNRAGLIAAEVAADSLAIKNLLGSH